MTTVYLVRHAESAPDRHVPEADWLLSAAGYQQAAALVPVLAELGVTALYSSPYTRAVLTLQPYADHAGLRIISHPGLRERKLATGFVDDWQAASKAVWDDHTFAHPGGESGMAVRARFTNAVVEIAAAHPSGRVALASHGNAIALYLGTLEPAAWGHAEWLAMTNPDVFEVTLGPTPTWRRIPLPSTP